MRFLTVAILFVSVASSAEPQASCVSVVRRDGGGSGTVVANKGHGQSLVVTCEHVTPTDKPTWVIATVDGHKRKVTAKLLAVERNDGTDLALLLVDATLPAATIATADPATGEAVTHHGKESGPQTGKVTQTITWARDRSQSTQADTLCVSGDSGAGLFNAKGELCGVIHGWQNNAADTDNSLACQVGPLRAFLRKNAGKWGEW